MVGKNYEIHFFEIYKNALQSSTMVGENLEIHFFEIANNALYVSISMTFPWFMPKENHFPGLFQVFPDITYFFCKFPGFPGFLSTLVVGT